MTTLPNRFMAILNKEECSIILEKCEKKVRDNLIEIANAKEMNFDFDQEIIDNLLKQLKELLEGFATTMTSGGDLHVFLDKHAESLLFEYRLEREKYTKTSETFMDIYISIAIAAPMILLLLFVVMGSTGTLSSFMGLSVNALSFLIILSIVLLNMLFILFLKLKQPKL